MVTLKNQTINHMKPQLLLSLAFLAFTSTFYGQDQQRVDSLVGTLKEQVDEERLLTLRELFMEYLYVDPKLAKPYLDEGIQIAQQLNDTSLIAQTTNEHAVFLLVNSNPKDALPLLKKALELYRLLGNKERESAMLNNMGNTYRSLGDYVSSLESHMKSLKIKEEIGVDSEKMAASYWNIGNSQGDLKNYEASTAWYRKAEVIYDSLDLDADYYNIRYLIGLNLKDLGNNEEAMSYFEEAIEYYKKSNRHNDLAAAYDNLGIIKMQNDDFDEAEVYFKKSLDISKNYGEETLVAVTMRNLGVTKYHQGKLKEALELQVKALEKLEEAGARKLMIKSHLHLSRVYHKLGMLEKALESHKKYAELNNEIMSTENIEKINELEIRYQTERKEAEIALQQEEINTLNERAKVDRLTKGLYAGGMFSFIAVSGLLFFGFRQRMKKNHIAREKQEEIYRQEIAHKKKELASQTLHLVQKNTFIQELKENLENIKASPEKFKTEFRRIVMLLRKENASDKDWEIFKTYFAEVHNDFDQKLKTLYPDISEKEIRLAAFLRMNLTTKEIAATLNVLPDSILKSKYRLKKKLRLDKDTDLNDFLNSL
ncbi:tetratricopeptide repeat protein [Flagellimonas olearia]|uniref:Tetratricopeptide repeat protein n=2 Tax=Flagellimonas olearia TaxID=552546 RepID=A0A6I1E2A4_9FLAO|nr:tetratricopeptide repeat protein [Allomuricauda olearia]